MQDIIKQRIIVAMPEAQVEVNSADGVHFQAYICSAEFEGKSPVARHRLVYAALGDLMAEQVHALQLTTVTPGEATC